MGSAQSARRIQPGGFGRPARDDGSPSPPPSGGGCREGTAARTAPAPVGRISTEAVRRDRLWVGWEGPAGRWLPASRRGVLQPPGSSSRRIPGPREMTAAAPSPLAPCPPPARGEARYGGRRGDGSPCSRRDCQPGRTVLSAPRPRRAAGRGGPRQGARGLRRCRQPTRPVLKHGPRSLTRARVTGSNESPWRNEGEGRRAPAEVGSRGHRVAEGAPPARLARPVGEVEHERTC